MDAMLTKKANELAKELATQATTIEGLNGAMRLPMKSALEKMLNTELEVHLGRGSHRLAETLTEAAADVPVDTEDDSPQPISSREIARTDFRPRRSRAAWENCR